MEVPKELARELITADLAVETVRVRGAVEVALAVWSVGSAVLSVAVAPEALRGSLEVVQEWLGREPSRSSLRVQGPGGQFETDALGTPEDLRAAFAAAEAVLFPGTTKP